MAGRKSNGPINGRSNGPDNGQGNGEERPPAMEMDEFVAVATARSTELLEVVWVSQAGPDARCAGGRLGKMALAPIDTLEDRCSEAWPGNHLLFLRAKWRDGRWAFNGLLPVASLSPAPTSTSDPTMHLVHRLEGEVKAALAARGAAPPATNTIDDAVKLLRAMRELSPTAPAAGEGGGNPIENLQAMVTTVKNIAGDLGIGGGVVAESLAHLAIRELAPGAKELMGAVAQLVIARATAPKKPEGEA
jgi:hypothetical protein